MKLPLEISKIIEISDPVYTFCEVVNHVDLNRYLVIKEHRTGRPRYDSDKLLKVILFAFMENGYNSVRDIEKLCKTDIRFMWLLDGTEAPSFMTVDNFMRDCLASSIEDIFKEINSYIFKECDVDLNHIYIDGTKLPANANKYSWVWKKSSIRNRDKTFLKVTKLLEEMNEIIIYQGVKFGTRTEYAIEYLEQIKSEFVKLTMINPNSAIRGRGHRKPLEIKLYDELCRYIDKLKTYADNINISGEHRNSYSKTDNGATFMRMKRDYMGNDQLLPGYNIQLGVCDEFIAVSDVMQYASDMDCFIPLMERFKSTYGFYPEYPVADAGYGSLNNYLFCEEKGMEKYMKFPMYKKETEDKTYRENPYRAVNFPINEAGNPVCPNGKKFYFVYDRPVKGNKYGRREEIYECEDCSDCIHKSNCTTAKGNRRITLNRELTSIHLEVIENLNCMHGALLRMNRSIQSEGTFGTIKWNRGYNRARRRGLNGLKFELSMISCGFNLYKYHLKKLRAQAAA